MSTSLFIRWLAGVLLFILASAALYGGVMFLIDPTGEKIDISQALLDNSPFSNYLVPGLILFLIFGLFSVYIILALIWKKNNFPSLLILQGILLILWLTIEIIVNTDFFHGLFHYPLYSMGILLILIGIVVRHRQRINT